MADSRTVQQLVADGSVVDEALRRAAAAARREYVRAGLSMPVWRSGHLLWIEPTELKQHEADGHAADLSNDGAEGNRAV
jgi:hypothetical protein